MDQGMEWNGRENPHTHAHVRVGRRSLDNASRRCLICDGPAHACARSREHPLPDVIAKVEALIDGWHRTH